METRIEILRDGVWRQLRLRDANSIKYNAVINRIGKLDSREISHTNTFSLPSVFQNTQALGINIFSPQSMAKTLNSKFEAKYYIENKLLQQGFLIINNTIGGKINVNFIDEALDIVEKWGSTTYQELLTSSAFTRPADYQAAINEMTNFSMDKTTLVGTLGNVGSRGFKLSEFPNNLNSIGDAFQSYADGNPRLNQSFNPYQSRPIFNVKSLFDLACETFGYTPEYSPSIDWLLIEKTFMVDKGLSENQEGGSNLVENSTPVVSESFYYEVLGTSGNYDFYHTFDFVGTPFLIAKKPSDINGWVTPPGFQPGHENRFCVYQPDISGSTAGTLRWECDIVPYFPIGTGTIFLYSVWENTAGSDVLFKSIPVAINNSSNTNIDITINKTQLGFPPVNGGDLIGVILGKRIDSNGTGFFTNASSRFENMTLTETKAPTNVVQYDEFGQYVSVTNSLTHAAPRSTVKELLSSYMQKDGILMSINNDTKIIKFFSYGHYESQRDAGNFSDWSSYQLKGDPKYNTDYGNSYAKRNQIGLSGPYTGNSFIKSLVNQGADSKYKDFATNLVKNFKDIESILSIAYLTTPYFEYKNTGLGLIEKANSIGPLTQTRADRTTQGGVDGITSLAAMQNVNYATIPLGVVEWYNLIDSAIRAEVQFLLPIIVMRKLDLSEPIYVEDLGGYYIIEEVAEYVNAQTPVNVKLIKLIDNLSAI